MSVPYRRSGAPVPYAPTQMRNFPAEYFSSADISIFFQEGAEDHYIDEITNFSFELIEKKAPVHSYASYTASRFLTGTRMVQGQFMTNMRAGNYLHDILWKDVSQAVNLQQLPFPIIEAGLPQPDPLTDPTGFALWVDQQKALFWSTIGTQVASGQPVDLSTTPYFTNTGFTILIVMGDMDSNDLTRNFGRVRSIDQVEIFSTGQSINLGSDNIMEQWQFVAADLNAGNRQDFLSGSFV